MADDENLASQFDKRDYCRMLNGAAPKVHPSQAVEGNNNYVLHHRVPIRRGGGFMT
ncbi:hypothetical protein [Streptomyces cuspidosporus]|uniref:hypothetical protein n=1 Tax=Streptomyces cuspidosporus TaxID=66882 RepID=UPI003D155D46